MKISKVHTTLLITMLLFGGVVFSSVLYPVSAQTAQPTSTVNPTSPPAATPISNSDLVDLQDKVQTLEEKILPFSILMAVLGVVGLASPFLVAKYAIDYHKKALRDAFYKTDPRNFPVYIPKRNFEVERKGLEKLGFKKSLRTYEFIGEIDSRGVIVFHIPGENFDHDEKAKSRMLQDIAELQNFIEENKDKPYAFVIYIKGQPKEVGTLLASTGNIASANMPVTIANHIYTLARGLMD